MKLTRFYNNKKTISVSNIDQITIANEIPADLNSENGIIGEYDILNKKIHAVFTFNKKNYLLLDEILLDLNSSIDIDYYCDFPDKESQFSIFQNDNLIYKISFYNEHPVFSVGFADPDIANFADRIARFISQLKRNPNIILFE